jgi:hypothetical protein
MTHRRVETPYIGLWSNVAQVQPASSYRRIRRKHHFIYHFAIHRDSTFTFFLGEPFDLTQDMLCGFARSILCSPAQVDTVGR